MVRSQDPCVDRAIISQPAQPKVEWDIMAVPKGPIRSLSNLPSRGRPDAYGNILNDSQPMDLQGGIKGEALRFACPYYRSDPVAYESCLKFGLHRIQDVKQHIRRKHSEPGSPDQNMHSSPREAFNGDSNISGSEMATGDASDRDAPVFAKKRRPRGVSDTERWCEIWEEEFGSKPAASGMAYLRSQLEEAVLMFQRFWADHEEEILRSVLHGTNSCTIAADKGPKYRYTHGAMKQMVASIVGRMSSPDRGGQMIKAEPRSPNVGDSDMMFGPSGMAMEEFEKPARLSTTDTAEWPFMGAEPAGISVVEPTCMSCYDDDLMTYVYDK